MKIFGKKKRLIWTWDAAPFFQPDMNAGATFSDTLLQDRQSPMNSGIDQKGIKSNSIVRISVSNLYG